ncbi:MAG: polysaccharide transporter PST, partial [Methylocystaceae bacterium]
KFLPAAELLPWMTVGVFGRVVSWPLGFVQLAVGASRWYAATETIFVLLMAGLTLQLMTLFGPVGAAYAFAANYAVYTATMLFVARRLIDFRSSRRVKEEIAAASAFLGLALLSRWTLIDASVQLCAALTILFTGTVFSLWGLASRAGWSASLSHRLSSTPIGRRFFAKSVRGSPKRGSPKT